MKNNIYLFLSPIVAATIANLFFIFYFFKTYGGIYNFFSVNKSADTNLLVMSTLLLTGVLCSTAAAIVSIFWIWFKSNK
jgi:hypothetical protein